MDLQLVRPGTEQLDGFLAALRDGWSPSTSNDVSAQLLAEALADPDAFLAGLDDRDPRGRTVRLPDGSEVPRIPGFARWMWDGEFCGSINMRWQPGTTDLPPTCLGHIGYAVVPWKQRRGYGTRALGLLLDEVEAELDLPFVELTTDLDNRPSQRVIEVNGGRLVGRVDKGAAYGGGEVLLFRIDLPRR